MNDIESCSKSENEKEISEFTFKKGTQKYRYQCRDCINLINKEYRKMNKDEVKIQRKDYCENIKNRNIKRRYDTAYRERNLEKIQLL